MTEDRVPALGLARYAREFYDAAIAVDDTIGMRPAYRFIAPIPVQHLVAHSIELILKAYIRGQEASEQDVRDLGHDLETCWSKARDMGVEEYILLSETELDTLRLISQLHWSTELRYIKTGFKQFPSFGNLQNLCTKLLDAICPLLGFK